MTGIGLRPEDYGTHSLRRTKASIICRQTGNLRAVQIRLGPTKIESTVRHHIELESHDVIIAEGALSETFVDDHSRAMFHNAQTCAARYPNADPVEAIYCAPREACVRTV